MCPDIRIEASVFSTSPFIIIAMDVEVSVHALLIIMLAADELVKARIAHFSAAKTSI
jgi:hypothetical protein